MAQISFVPQEMDMQIYQGGTVLIVCAATDVNGNPINMSGTGSQILAVIRSTQANTGNTVLATLTVTWVSQSTGQFNLSLTEAQTKALNWSGNAYWDIIWQDANTPQNSYPLAWGIVTLQNDVSY